MKQWIYIGRNVDEKNKHLYEIFKNEYLENRNSIKKICRDVNLQGSVLLSNHALFERMQKYLNSDDITSRKIRNTELSLLNYISRMVYKPSPFGSFAGLNYGNMTDDCEANYDIETCHYQCLINISLLKFIENKLLELKDFIDISCVAINSSLVIENNEILFIKRNIEGTSASNNTEKLIKIKLSKPLEIIIKFFKQTDLIKYQELINKFTRHYTKDDAEKFINKSISAGFLQNFLVQPNQKATYLNDLVKITANFETLKIKDINNLLSELYELQAVYYSKPPTEQNNILRKIKSIILNIGEIFEEKVDINLDSLIFVDTCFPKFSFKITDDFCDKFEEDLILISQFMRLFDDCVLQVIASRILFNENCNNQSEMDMIHMYSLHIATDRIELWKKVQNDPTYNKIKALRERVYDYLNSQLSENYSKIKLQKSWLLNLISEYPVELLELKKFSYYVQMHNDKNKEMIILNKLGPGYYRHYSRYVNLFNGYNAQNDFNNYVKSKYKSMQQEKDVQYVDINAILGLF